MASGNSPRLSGRPVSSRRSAKVADKLQQKIRDREYYEAHQTYRVLYQRYKAQGKEGEALGLLYDGALLLLQHGQVSSGSDLSMLMVNHLKENMTPVSDEWLEKIGKIFSQYRATSKRATPLSSATPPDPTNPLEEMDTSPLDPGPAGMFEVVPEVDSREGFIRAALKWSNMVADGGQWKYGHPKLHKVAAITYWREKRYGKAREHFIYAEEPQEYGNMLVELATTFGYRGEADLFIAQAVLQLLVLKDRKGGLGVFNSYTRKHPVFKSDNPPYMHHPTLNFVWFLLSACKDRSKEVFQCLRVNYTSTINRDPTFNEYLDKIGEVFFGRPVQSHQPNTGGSAAAPGPSGMFGLGGPGGLIEGILNSISGVLPRAAGMATGPAAGGPPMGGPGVSGSPMQGGPPSQATFTMSESSSSSSSSSSSRENQTHQVHVGTTTQNWTPRPGEPLREPRPAPEPTFTIAGGPFMTPANIRLGAPQVNIHFGPPPPRNPSNPSQRNPNVRVHRMRNPQQQGGIRIAPPRGPRGPNIRFGHPPEGPNLRFVTPPRPGGNSNQPGHIRVVGFRMEGVPIQVPGGVMMGGMGSNGGPVITPEQQQLYQEHTQQSSGGGGGQQPEEVPPRGSNSGASPRQQPPPRSNEDMELD